MHPLPPIAELQCGVFSSAQAKQAGMTRSALSHAGRAGHVHRLRVGAYQQADLSHLDKHEQERWRHAGQAIAAVLTTPGAAASHSTAAVLRGVPLLYIPQRPCALVAPWHTGEIPRVHVHRCTGDRPQPVRIGDVHCTSIERTLIDLAREHGVIAGVMSLDHALHSAMTDPPQLHAELERCKRWPGVRAAREAIDLADARSESPLESRSRLKLREFGMPVPEPQVSIGNEWGGFVGRVDFYWDEFGVVGEVDGALKYEGDDPRPWYKEKLREERLADLGLIVVRWGAADLRHFDIVVDRLRRAFARGAACAGTERRWTVLPTL